MSTPTNPYDKTTPMNASPVAGEATARGAAFFTDEQRWDAVVLRNRDADSAFYYSVRTTGVYCRPSCASRAARQENVRFHTSCDAAERAGFRPCQRCRPRDADLAQRHAAAVANACRLIDDAESMPSLDALAEAGGMSRFHFHRVFKAVCGVTPKAYADARRARRVGDVLASAPTVTEAIYGSGFNSNGPFYASSTDRLGMTPTAYRRGGDGKAIRFAVGECSMGSILVAATDKGVCSIAFGDDPETLVRGLQDRFPNAKFAGGEPDFERLVSRVVGLVETPGGASDLPLDVRGTAFQQLVWQALRGIPAGSTASYSEIARRIGNSKATRAVAQACASNPVAVAIPCHRVVRTDGSLSGYRWGIDRKRALLTQEAHL